MLAASLADEKALSIQYPSISPCCICKRDLPCPCVASSDRIIPHVHPYAMRTAGRSYNCVRGSVTNTSPSVLPGPSRQQDQAVYGHAWRGGSRHRACCSSSRAKASLSVSVRPCFAICSGGQGQPTRPVALLCVRRPPAMRVASAAVHAFNSIQTGEACRISPSGRYGSRSLSLSLYMLSTAIAAAVSSTPCRPAPPRPTRRRRRPLRLGLHERCSATVQSFSTALTSPMLTSC